MLSLKIRQCKWYVNLVLELDLETRWTIIVPRYPCLSTADASASFQMNLNLRKSFLNVPAVWSWLIWSSFNNIRPIYRFFMSISRSTRIQHMCQMLSAPLLRICWVYRPFLFWLVGPCSVTEPASDDQRPKSLDDIVFVAKLPTVRN